MDRIMPVTLTGSWVVLEPLAIGHVEDLAAVGLDPDLWQWIPTPVATLADMRRYVEVALEEQARGVSLPFVQRDARTGAVIGSTRYGAIALEHRRVEIGWTWIARSHHRTGVNTEAKYLLLRHAFDTLGLHRVELKTDALNARSRAAITRIGATQEGIFRRHMVTASGRVRDTVYFSVVADEWPAVRERLESRLA